MLELAKTFVGLFVGVRWFLGNLVLFSQNVDEISDNERLTPKPFLV